MRISTFLTVALFGSAAAAQTTPTVSAGSRQRFIMPTLMAQGNDAVGKILKAARKNTRQNAIWRPQKERMELYSDGEWLTAVETDYTYDNNGNVRVMVQNEDGTFTKTTYTYNTNGRKISEITETDEDNEGASYKKSKKKETSYDPVVTDCVTASTTYEWDGVENDWHATSNGYKRKITRDETSGNITTIVIAMPFGDTYEDIEKTTLTYTAGKADSYAYQQLAYDSKTGTVYWGTPTTYKNLVWDTTDGQIVSDFDQLLVGNNRILKADKFVGEQSDGNIDVSYVEGKRDFTATYISADKLEKSIHMLATIDDNGSFKEEFRDFADDNGDNVLSDDEYVSEYVIQTFDANGNTVSEEYFTQEPGEDPVITSGTRYTYAYDPACGEISEIITEEYVAPEDGATEGHYEKSMRIVSSDFTDVVSTGISRPVAGTAGTTTVYNLQGIALGTTLDRLPAGIYIVRDGANIHKVLKK